VPVRPARNRKTRRAVPEAARRAGGVAIVLGKSEANACMAALEAEPDVAMSAGTLAEALIVAHRRNVAKNVARQHSCPSLFVGDDFSKTDLESVLERSHSRSPTQPPTPTRT
jgi:uncharacterized protein with PIN domain